ncbi:hypothetical protein D3C71_1837260 [compost metagenome]
MVRMWSWTWNMSDSSSSARTIAAAGLKLLSATSLVGARIKCSSSWRQQMITAVNMMPAAIVDFVFFLLMSSPYSRIRCFPVSTSYPPKIARTKSKTHSSEHSPKVWCRYVPMASS